MLNFTPSLFKKTLLPGLILFIFLSLFFLLNKTLIYHKTSTNSLTSTRTVVITIDDVSPIYSLDKHEKLFSIIDKHNAIATLFVIPDYLGQYPVTQNNAWIEIIKKQQERGYEIAQHGYKHTNNEFGLLNYDQAKEKLLLGKSILEGVFGSICGFRPPNWAENYEVKKALKDLGYCYDADAYALKFEHGWKTNLWITEFLKTDLEYEIVSKINKPFVIVLHVESMNEEGYKYLDEFLTFAEKHGAVFKTYYDAYGQKVVNP